MAKATAEVKRADQPRRRERAASPVRVVLVTGMSGAGHSSALKAFEDMGYEAVDNLPLALLQGLAPPGAAMQRPMAIGIDVRTRGFGAEAFLQELDRLAQHEGLDVRLLYLDCDDEALFRRYTETRRRHPLTADRPVADSVRHERQMLSPLRERADLTIDTTMLTAADLKRVLNGHFQLERRAAMAVFVASFAYRNGVPREADLVFDVRFLENPHYDPALKPLTGRDRKVAERIAADPDYKPFIGGLKGLLEPLLPRYVHEGKSYLTIAVGCTGGRHRSVFVAEDLAAWLEGLSYPVTLTHRDIDRGGAGASGGAGANSGAERAAEQAEAARRGGGA
jgi:UPF0042 nucleotide-binding protein